MAVSIERLTNMLGQAHTAGDVEGATFLANAIRDFTPPAVPQEQRDEAGIENMLAAAVADYVGWANKLGGKSEIRLKMDEDYKNSFTVKNGSKYIKISNESGGTWGFVVNTDNDKKFKKGDLLKAAGYSAPARNAARGNVLEGGFAIQWTGPLYLV